MSGLGLKQLGKNTSLTLGRQLLTALLGLITVILLARLLGPGGNGIYQMVFLLPTMIVTLSNLGIGPATVYYVARKDYPLKTIISANLILGLIISAIACIIAVILVLFFGDKIFPAIPIRLLLIVILIIPISLLQSYLLTIFQGLQDFKVFNLISIVPQGVILLLVVLGVWILDGGVKAAIAANMLGSIVALSITLYYLKPYLDFRVIADRGYIFNALNYGIKAHLSNIMAFLNERLDMFLVNGFLNPAAVGIYSIAVQIVEKLWMLSQSVSTVILPRISELKDEEEIRKQLTPLISRWVLMTTLVLSVLLAFIAPYLIPLLFGKGFVNSGTALQIMLPGIVLGSASRVLSNDFAARGRPEINTYLAIITLSINVAGNLIMIPKMGINGAALATTISYVVNAFLKITIYSYLVKVKWYKTLLPEKRDFIMILAIIPKRRG